MLRTVAFVSAVAVFISFGEAHAACPNFPYVLSNGTTADATQVNADFNNVTSCFAPLASPAFTGNLSISSSNGYQLAISSAAANQQASINFNVPGAAKWSIGRDTDLSFFVWDAVAGRSVMRVQSNGNLSIMPEGGSVGVGGWASGYEFQVNGAAGGTGPWANLSDARLKKDVTPISNALESVMRLRGVRYSWRSVDERKIGKSLTLPDTPQVGFIAQEVAAVIPEAVVAPKTGDDPYTLKETDIVPFLVEALKEQQAEIEHLTAKVEALSAVK